jgi:hypothetical protein
MSRLHTSLAPLLAVTLMLMSGSFRVRSHFSPVEKAPSFIAGSLILPEKLMDKIGDPAKVLDLALKTLSPGNVSWLRTRIDQRIRTDDFCFAAHSSLVRGPNHCVRLRTSLEGHGEASQILVVSDGAVLAQVLRLPGREQQTHSATMPVTAAERDRLFQEKGCCGPYELLLALRQKLSDLKLTGGELDGRPVVRISGTLNSEATPVHLRFARPAKSCQLFLDAETLLPMRVEWWADGLLVLEINYHDLILNTPLDHDECVKEFSLKDDGS